MEQGNVLRRKFTPEHVVKGLNPFGTGQCLTTSGYIFISRRVYVSIPLEQGNVLRPELWCVSTLLKGLNPFGTGQCLTTLMTMHTGMFGKSQSLWNRAMSYDCLPYELLSARWVSIPLEQGNVLRRTKQLQNE